VVLDNTNIVGQLWRSQLSCSLSRLNEPAGLAVGKNGSHGSTERLDCGSQGSHPDPLDHGQTHFSDLDHGSDQPDVGDGGKSEDDGPEDGEGEDEDSGENPVEPELGLTEQDERQAPQRIKPVGRVWLSENVSKVEL